MNEEEQITENVENNNVFNRNNYEINLDEGDEYVGDDLDITKEIAKKIEITIIISLDTFSIASNKKSDSRFCFIDDTNKKLIMTNLCNIHGDVKNLHHFLKICDMKKD